MHGKVKGFLEGFVQVFFRHQLGMLEVHVLIHHGGKLIKLVFVM